MSRPLLIRVHLTAAVAAIAVIVTFLISMNFHDGRTLARRRRAARRGPARSARAARPMVNIRA
jgi:hypothetical protein